MTGMTGLAVQISAAVLCSLVWALACLFAAIRLEEKMDGAIDGARRWRVASHLSQP